MVLIWNITQRCYKTFTSKPAFQTVPSLIRVNRRQSRASCFSLFLRSHHRDAGSANCNYPLSRLALIHKCMDPCRCQHY